MVIWPLPFVIKSMNLWTDVFPSLPWVRCLVFGSAYRTFLFSHLEGVLFVSLLFIGSPSVFRSFVLYGCFLFARFRWSAGGGTSQPPQLGWRLSIASPTGLPSLSGFRGGIAIQRGWWCLFPRFVYFSFPCLASPVLFSFVYHHPTHRKLPAWWAMLVCRAGGQVCFVPRLYLFFFVSLLLLWLVSFFYWPRFLYLV